MWSGLEGRIVVPSAHVKRMPAPYTADSLEYSLAGHPFPLQAPAVTWKLIREVVEPRQLSES